MVMGVSLKLESESKPSSVSLMVPTVQDMVQQTRYLEAGVGRDRAREGKKGTERREWVE